MLLSVVGKYGNERSIKRLLSSQQCRMKNEHWNKQKSNWIAKNVTPWVKKKIKKTCTEAFPSEIYQWSSSTCCELIHFSFRRIFRINKISFGSMILIFSFSDHSNVKIIDSNFRTIFPNQNESIHWSLITLCWTNAPVSKMETRLSRSENVRIVFKYPILKKKNMDVVFILPTFSKDHKPVQYDRLELAFLST